MLAWILYRQTLASLSQAEGIDRVVVVTSDADIAGHARRSGALVFDEADQVSHSVSADAACLRAIEMGATTALLVPIDVPLATAADFTALAAAAGQPVTRAAAHAVAQALQPSFYSPQVAPEPRLIVVPSTDGTGTNALSRTPPNVIESRFGPGSCRAHFDQARAKSVHAELLRLPRLMFDIDTPEDVAQLLAGSHTNEVAAFLRTACASK
jgi:2-phospho-L-lactate guanylyltransferase (CobY/MobA/RfbA family)